MTLPYGSLKIQATAAMLEQREPGNMEHGTSRLQTRNAGDGRVVEPVIPMPAIRGFGIGQRIPKCGIISLITGKKQEAEKSSTKHGYVARKG